MGDFTSAIGPILALRSVGEELARVFGGLDLLPICVTKPKGERGTRIQEKVWHLKPTRLIRYNPELSTLERKACCDVCGRRSYRILGTETDPGEELIGERWEPVPGKPRQPGNGVLLPRSAIEGTPIFLYEPFTLVTDDVRRFIEGKGWTNVWFQEYGEVVDGSPWAGRFRGLWTRNTTSSSWSRSSSSAPSHPPSTRWRARGR